MRCRIRPPVSKVTGGFDMASFKRGGIRNAILRVLADHSAPGITFARADFASRARSGISCHVGNQTVRLRPMLLKSPLLRAADVAMSSTQVGAGCQAGTVCVGIGSS